MLKAMKKAGCIQVSFGVESGSQTTLNYYRKGVKVEKIAPAFEMCNKAGIIARANIMVGAPCDTRETMQETLDMLKVIKPDFVYTAPTTPAVGTDLFFDAKEKNLLRKDSLSHYDRLDISTMKRQLSDSEVREYLGRVVRTYKKGIYSIIINPIQLYKRKHLFYRIFMHWLTMMKRPDVLFRDIMYYITYANKERMD
jgi:radical SAM superfamily enzyme YgiQ (UPF0313 family)